MPMRKWGYAAMVAAHMAYVVIVPRLFTLHASGSPGRLTLDAVGIIVTVAFGYTSFLRFISVTATRYVRAQAEIDLARDIHRVLVPAVEKRDRRLRVSRLVARERRRRRRPRGHRRTGRTGGSGGTWPMCPEHGVGFGVS